MTLNGFIVLLLIFTGLLMLVAHMYDRYHETHRYPQGPTFDHKPALPRVYEPKRNRGQKR